MEEGRKRSGRPLSVHQEHKKKGQITREDAPEKSKKKSSQISSIDNTKKRGLTSRVDAKDSNKKRGQLFREDSIESLSRKKGLSSFRKTDDVTDGSKKRGHSSSSFEDSRKGSTVDMKKRNKTCPVSDNLETSKQKGKQSKHSTEDSKSSGGEVSGGKRGAFKPGGPRSEDGKGSSKGTANPVKKAGKQGKHDLDTQGKGKEGHGKRSKSGMSSGDTDDKDYVDTGKRGRGPRVNDNNSEGSKKMKPIRIVDETDQGDTGSTRSSSSSGSMSKRGKRAPSPEEDNSKDEESSDSEPEEMIMMCRPARSAAIVSKAISEAQQEYEDQEMPMPPKQPFKRRIPKKLQNLTPEISELENTTLKKSKEVNDRLDPAGESVKDQLAKTEPAIITLEEIKTTSTVASPVSSVCSTESPTPQPTVNISAGKTKASDKSLPVSPKDPLIISAGNSQVPSKGSAPISKDSHKSTIGTPKVSSKTSSIAPKTEEESCTGSTKSTSLNTALKTGDTKPSEDKKIIPKKDNDTINAKDDSVTEAKDAEKAADAKNAVDAKDANNAADAKDAKNAADAKDAKIEAALTDVKESKNIKADVDTKVGIKIPENINSSLKDKNDIKGESDSLVDQDDSCSSPVDSSLSEAAWDPRSEASVDLMLSSLKREYLVFINNFKSQAFRKLVQKELEEERERNRLLNLQKQELEEDIKKITDEGTLILKVGLKKLEIEAETPTEFISKAKDIVAQHTDLEWKMKTLEREIQMLEMEQIRILKDKENQLIQDLSTRFLDGDENRLRWIVKNELNAIIMEEHNILGSRSGTPGARSGTPGSASQSGTPPIMSRGGSPRVTSVAREPRPMLKSTSSYNSKRSTCDNRSNPSSSAPNSRPGSSNSGRSAAELRPGSSNSRGSAAEARPGSSNSCRSAAEARPGSSNSCKSGTEARPGRPGSSNSCRSGTEAPLISPDPRDFAGMNTKDFNRSIEMKELQGLELSGSGWRGKDNFSTDEQAGDIRDPMARMSTIIEDSVRNAKARNESVKPAGAGAATLHPLNREGGPSSGAPTLPPPPAGGSRMSSRCTPPLSSGGSRGSSRSTPPLHSSVKGSSRSTPSPASKGQPRLKEAWVTAGGGSGPGATGGTGPGAPGQYNNPYLDPSQIQASNINSFTQNITTSSDSKQLAGINQQAEAGWLRPESAPRPPSTGSKRSLHTPDFVLDSDLSLSQPLQQLSQPSVGLGGNKVAKLDIPMMPEQPNSGGGASSVATIAAGSATATVPLNHTSYQLQGVGLSENLLPEHQQSTQQQSVHQQPIMHQQAAHHQSLNQQLRQQQTGQQLPAPLNMSQPVPGFGPSALARGGPEAIHPTGPDPGWDGINPPSADIHKMVEKGTRWQDMISSEFDRLVALAGEVDRRSLTSTDASGKEMSLQDATTLMYLADQQAAASKVQQYPAVQGQDFSRNMPPFPQTAPGGSSTRGVPGGLPYSGSGQMIPGKAILQSYSHPPDGHSDHPINQQKSGQFVSLPAEHHNTKSISSYSHASLDSNKSQGSVSSHMAAYEQHLKSMQHQYSGNLISSHSINSYPSIPDHPKGNQYNNSGQQYASSSNMSHHSRAGTDTSYATGSHNVSPNTRGTTAYRGGAGMSEQGKQTYGSSLHHKSDLAATRGYSGMPEQGKSGAQMYGGSSSMPEHYGRYPPGAGEYPGSKPAMDKRKGSASDYGISGGLGDLSGNLSHYEQRSLEGRGIHQQYPKTGQYTSYTEANSDRKAYESRLQYTSYNSGYPSSNQSTTNTYMYSAPPSQQSTGRTSSMQASDYYSSAHKQNPGMRPSTLQQQFCSSSTQPPPAHTSGLQATASALNRDSLGPVGVPAHNNVSPSHSAGAVNVAMHNSPGNSGPMGKSMLRSDSNSNSRLPEDGPVHNLIPNESLLPGSVPVHNDSTSNRLLPGGGLVINNESSNSSLLQGGVPIHNNDSSSSSIVPGGAPVHNNDSSSDSASQSTCDENLSEKRHFKKKYFEQMRAEQMSN